MSINRGMHKEIVVYPYNGTKRNEVLIPATTLMDCKTIMLGERSQTQKSVYEFYKEFENRQN